MLVRTNVCDLVSLARVGLNSVLDVYESYTLLINLLQISGPTMYDMRWNWYEYYTYINITFILQFLHPVLSRLHFLNARSQHDLGLQKNCILPLLHASRSPLCPKQS